MTKPPVRELVVFVRGPEQGCQDVDVQERGTSGSESRKPFKALTSTTPST
jgi:hypothetical protein